jgi:hypothetical protein
MVTMAGVVTVLAVHVMAGVRIVTRVRVVARMHVMSGVRVVTRVRVGGGKPIVRHGVVIVVHDAYSPRLLLSS